MDWKEIAENLAGIAGDDWLSSRVRERIVSCDHLFIACSGGADSVFLALYFGRLFQEKQLGGAVSVLHFNHKLRGEQSDRDEAFTRELCEGLGLVCKTGEWERLVGEKPVSEEAARDARMAFFAKGIGSATGISEILTGHHADDIAETMLMRLSRGSGLQGLAAPREFSVGANGLKFIRPLLGLSKQGIVSCLKAAGASWREDESNQEGLYYRNRLRQSVIPEWERVADRSLRGGVAQSRALLEEDWLALEEFFEGSWLEVRLDSEVLDWTCLLAMPRAFQRRSINRLLAEAGASGLSLAAMEGTLDLLRTERAFKMSVEKGVWLVGSPKSGKVELLRWKQVRDWAPFRLPLEVKVYLPGAGMIRAREIELDTDLIERIRSGVFAHEETVFLAADGKSMGSLHVRLWRAGDAYRPMGRTSLVKLKELFIDRKVPREARSVLPIVVDSENNILWTPGLPPCWDCRIEKQTTRALQLTYEK